MLHSLSGIRMVLLLVICVCLACGVEDEYLLSAAEENEAPITSPVEHIENQPPPGLEALLLAYPEHLRTVDSNTVYWINDVCMIYDDGISKNFDDLLNSADLEDQMSIEYQPGSLYTVPIPVNHDPGRIRNEDFFREMYGNSEEEVRASLVPIVWLPTTEGRTLYVTSVNQVDQHLQRVSNELDMLNAEMKTFVINPAGTFCWRFISGTERLSMHSFGIAIDINIDKANYWKWDQPDDSVILNYKNEIPWEIIEIFENHGFIWGGKWYHYDTMHFEYRPELLQP